MVLPGEDAGGGGVGGGGGGKGGGGECGEGFGGAARWRWIGRLIDEEGDQLPFIRAIQPLILIFRKRVQQEVKEALKFLMNFARRKSINRVRQSQLANERLHILINILLFSPDKICIRNHVGQKNGFSRQYLL